MNILGKRGVVMDYLKMMLSCIRDVFWCFVGGDKVPRKGGPGITQSDLLVINKTDLAEAVGADLKVGLDFFCFFEVKFNIYSKWLVQDFC